VSLIEDTSPSFLQNVSFAAGKNKSSLSSMHINSHDFVPEKYQKVEIEML
jgi:hypothetical protein